MEKGPSIYPLDPTVPNTKDNGLDTVVTLPNFIDELPFKHVRLQMFFDGPVPGDQIDLDMVIGDPEPTAWQIIGGSGPVTDHTHWFDIEIRPNPDWEQITIFGSTPHNIIPGNLLTIEVDTISFPEPAALSMLAIGSLAMLRRKRRA